MIDNQFDTKIKSIRNDNEIEFINQKTSFFLKSEGIIHERTCPYTPQQNGLVERKHIYLLETARALIFQFILPLKY